MKRRPNPTCHADNPNDAVYCHMCGRKMKTKATWPFVLIGIVAVVFAVMFGIMEFDSPKNENKMEFIVNGVSFNMIKVDGGSFSMGATYEQGSEAMWWEEPVHQVSLSNMIVILKSILKVHHLASTVFIEAEVG